MNRPITALPRATVLSGFVLVASVPFKGTLEARAFPSGASMWRVTCID